jgi:DNA-binding NarL/FixJ family response regulator
MAAQKIESLIRVGICNPNLSIRSGKSMLIGSQADMQVVFEAATFEEVLESIDDLTLDVLVIDHRMSGQDGISLVKAVNQRFFERGEWPPTMIVTAPYFAVELDIAVMRAGAADFVVEESGPEVLLAAIRKSGAYAQNLDILALNDLFAAVKLGKRNEAGFNLALANLDGNARLALEAFSSGLADIEISQSLSMTPSQLEETFRQILIHFGFATRLQLALALYESDFLA